MNLSSLNTTQSAEYSENTGPKMLSRLATIGASLPNNLSFKNLLDMPNKSADPESVFDELRQLELEVEQAKKTKQLEESETSLPHVEEIKLNEFALDKPDLNVELVVETPLATEAMTKEETVPMTEDGIKELEKIDETVDEFQENTGESTEIEKKLTDVIEVRL